MEKNPREKKVVHGEKSKGDKSCLHVYFWGRGSLFIILLTRIFNVTVVFICKKKATYL